VFPLEQTRHVGVAKSEHPRLTNGEIIFEESNLCDHNPPTLQRERQTRQTTCDHNTALSTKVHSAVKTATTTYGRSIRWDCKAETKLPTKITPLK